MRNKYLHVSQYPLLMQCLDDDYSDCINPLFLMSQSVPLSNSYAYVAIINSLQLRCGEGFQGYHPIIKQSYVDAANSWKVILFRGLFLANIP